MKRKFLLLLPVLLTGCVMDYFDRRVSVVNKSPVRIAVEIVSDTTERTANNIAYYLSHPISPNDTSFITRAGKNAWLEYINKGKGKTLYVYFFDLDSLNKYEKGGADMSYLLGNKKYLKRVGYSLDELTKSNWEIKYQ